MLDGERFNTLTIVERFRFLFSLLHLRSPRPFAGDDPLVTVGDMTCTDGSCWNDKTHSRGFTAGVRNDS